MTSPENLHECLSRYDEAVELASSASKPKARLVELEGWYRTELKQAILRRETKWIEKEELVKLVDWKLTRGKWRPKLLDYAKQHTERVVKDTSGAAFKLAEAGSVEDGLKKLCELKGIGVATASAILAAALPEVPFMSDELMQFCLGLRDYTLKTYRRLLASCTAKAQAYTDAPADTKPDPWTPYEFEQAIWAYAVLGAKKRKQAEARQESAAASPAAGEGAPKKKLRSASKKAGIKK